MRFIQWIAKNKIAATITFLSLLSLIPFGFFFNYANELNELQDINSLDVSHANKVLTRSIDLPELYLPFIFGVFIWVANGSFSAYGFARKKTGLIFSLGTLALGGLGIHLLILVCGLIPIKKLVPQIMLNKVVRISSTVTLGTTITVAPFMVAIFAKSFEDPSIAQPVKFSLDKNHPNLVEIFSDGFDLKHFDNYKDYDADSNFDEFKWFKNFATAGHPTHLSLSMILNDFSESNPFREMYDNDLKPSEYQPYEYSHGSLKNGIAHLAVAKNEFNARTIINPAAFSSSTEYGQSLSGMPESIKEKDSTINVTNWVGARDANATKGFNTNPIDIQGYKWLANTAEQTQGKGARVYVADMITHRPFAVDGNQQFSVWNTDREHVAKSLRKTFDDVITSLKNIKDASGFSAFDNSMIMIFGDHASHDFMDYLTGDNVTRACESSFIIKFPKQSDGTQQNQNTMQHVDDKFIWSPQINSIIKDYFEAPVAAKNNASYFNEYFNNNPNPSKFNNLPRPVFNSISAYGTAIWKQNNTGEWEYNIEDKTKTPIIFASNKLEQKMQVDELAKVVY